MLTRIFHIQGQHSGFRPAILFLLLICLNTVSSWSQTISFPVREVSGGVIYGNALSATPSVNVIDVENDQRSAMISSPTSFSTAVKYKSNNTLVKFGVNHAASATILPNFPYTYKLIYKLEGSKILGTGGNTAAAIIDTLVVSYNPDSLATFQDLEVKVYPGNYNEKLSVLKIYYIKKTGSKS